MTEEELAAIEGLAARRGRVPGPTAARMACEIRRLRTDLHETIGWAMEMLAELEQRHGLDGHHHGPAPPRAPRLADFDS